jgi:hypothetical protein
MPGLPSNRQQQKNKYRVLFACKQTIEKEKTEKKKWQHVAFFSLLLVT